MFRNPTPLPVRKAFAVFSLTAALLLAAAWAVVEPITNTLSPHYGYGVAHVVISTIFLAATLVAVIVGGLAAVRDQ